MSALGDASTDERRELLTIPADHPCLAGHFPGNPLVPGVVLLDEAIVAIERARGMSFSAFRLASVKFLQPVKPPATLQVRHRLNGMSIDFAVESSREGGVVDVASGRLEPIASVEPIGGRR